MPWNIKKSGHRWAIIKALSGEVVGHSDTKEKALAAMRARYANMSLKDKIMMKNKKMMKKEEM